MRIRCFVAINFPLTLTRRIADEISTLRAPVEAAGWKVAWVPAANLHLMLKFLGMIEDSSVEAIQGRLRRELGGRAPFELEARGLGAFPDGGEAASVLWVGVKPSPPLAALQQDLERWLEETGYPREPRPFHPHLTIGRVKQAGAQPLGPLLATRDATTFGQARATEVVIYESRTPRSGSEYLALGRIPIGETRRT